MSHQRRSLSWTSSSTSSSSVTLSFLWRVWIYFRCNAKAILSLPFFLKVIVRQAINYCSASPSSSSSLRDSYPCSSGNCCKKNRTATKRKTGESRLDCETNQTEEYCWKIGKMAHTMSKGLALLAFAFTVHFILIYTLADKGSADDYSSWSSLSSSSSGDAVVGRAGFYDFRRRPRSYRSDRDSSKPVAMANIVGAGPVGAGVSSRSSSSSSSSTADKSDALFATENSTVVTAQIGSTANLPCVVKNLGNGVASWIRRHDYHLLTVGMGTYSNDDRFVVSHNRPNQNWELHIKFVKPSDEGMYECQISTHPPSSIFIRLRVVEAKAEILGEPDKHVRSGSTFELVCVLRDSTEPPVYVFWYHNDRMINYDNERGVVVSSDVEKSILTIQEAQKSDSGNYTCQPSNASPSWIVVHILNGEKPAAMQHGSRNAAVKIQNSHSQSSLFIVISILSVLVTRWLTHVGFHVLSLKMEEAICDDEEDDDNLSEQNNHYHPRQVVPTATKASSREHNREAETKTGTAKNVAEKNENEEEHPLRVKVTKVKSNFEQPQQADKLSVPPSIIIASCKNSRGIHKSGWSSDSRSGGECCERLRRRRHGRYSHILDSFVRSHDGPTATSCISSTTTTTTTKVTSIPAVSHDAHVKACFPPCLSRTSPYSSFLLSSSSSTPSSYYDYYHRTEHETDCMQKRRRRNYLSSYQNFPSVVVLLPVLLYAEAR